MEEEIIKRIVSAIIESKMCYFNRAEIEKWMQRNKIEETTINE